MLTWTTAHNTTSIREVSYQTHHRVVGGLEGSLNGHFHCTRSGESWDQLHLSQVHLTWRNTEPTLSVLNIAGNFSRERVGATLCESILYKHTVSKLFVDVSDILTCCQNRDES